MRSKLSQTVVDLSIGLTDAILLIPPRDGEYRQDGLLEDRNVLKHFLESAGIPVESAFYKDYQVVQQSCWKMQQLLLHMPAARAAPRATAAAAATIEDSGQVAAAAATPAMAARRVGFITNPDACFNCGVM